ncbi:MAG: DUF3592 domain-containing protein [Phycisphaerales bacterium]
MAKPTLSLWDVIFAITIALLAFGVAGYSLVDASSHVRAHIEAKSWIATDGSVQLAGTNPRRRVRDVVVLYEYEVDGVVHAGRRLTTSGNLVSRWSAWDPVDDLRSTDTVRVFYNPAEPSESVLFRLTNTQLMTELLWNAFGFLLCLAVGVAVVWVFVKRLIAKSAATTESDADQ